MTSPNSSVGNESHEYGSRVKSRVIDVESFRQNDRSQVESFVITTQVDTSLSNI